MTWNHCGERSNCASMIVVSDPMFETTMQGSPFQRRLRLSDTAVIWLTGLAFSLVHIATSGRYGFHRDELLTYSNARHLDWCYVVYPPLTAWLACVELAIFGANLVGFRLFAAIAIGLLIVLTGLTARALGGGRRAMIVAAIAAAIEPPIVFSGSFFSYMTFDLLWWVAVAWCAACLLRSGNPRWWLGIGAAIGLGFLSKYTMAFLVAGLLAGMLLTPNRRYLRSAWFWGGVAIATVIVLPVVIWQFQHHFVGFTWMQSIHARDVRWGRTDYFVPSQFWRTTNPVTVPLWLGGLWFLFATPAGKPFRILGWMYVCPLVLLLLARGRDYYLGPAYPMLLAAGAVYAERHLAVLAPHSQTVALRIARNSLAIGALVTFALVLPIAPVNSTWWRIADAANDRFNMEIGWPELAATVAKVRDSLPASDREALGVMAGDEGEAGAINLYGRAYGLPEAISGMNSNWLRGYGNPPPRTVIAIGFTHEELGHMFTSCTRAGSLPHPYGIVNHTIGDRADIWVCYDVRGGWPAFWKEFQYYG
jgi:4-amino-4-deoxy-L-arabinose transferase-like glycosyltransferase